MTIDYDFLVCHNNWFVQFGSSFLSGGKSKYLAIVVDIKDDARNNKLPFELPPLINETSFNTLHVSFSAEYILESSSPYYTQQPAIFNNGPFTPSTVEKPSSNTKIHP